MHNKNEPLLLVEDDSVDAMTVKRALKEIGTTNPLVMTTNGEEALTYLREKGNKKPDIILLDLNMPAMNGLELLAVIKEDLKHVPVIVLMTSHDKRDRRKSFEMSVAGDLTKPVDYSQFVSLIITLNMYRSLSMMPDQGRIGGVFL